MQRQKQTLTDKNNVVKFNQIHILVPSVFSRLFMSVPSGEQQEIYLYNSLRRLVGREQLCQGISGSWDLVDCRSEDEEDWLWGGTNTRLLLAAATFGGLVLSLGGSLMWRAARSRWNTVH